MKKKIIIISGIIVLLLAGIAISVGVINQISSAEQIYNIKAYTYHPVTVLDNKIENRDAYILPFIYETPDDRISKSYLEAEFAKAKLTIKSISSTKIGTGTIIKTNEDAKPYQILVYGDVNGDGRVGLADSEDIMEMYLNPDVAEKQLKGIYYTAGNVRNEDNKVNLVDAQRITDFYLENITSILSKPPKDDPITGIEVIVSDVKLVYNYGEKLDLTGIKVRRVTASGVKCIIEDLPANCVTGYNKTKEGEQTLNVNYAGFKTTFTVKVLKKVTNLIIDTSCKTEDTSIGNEIVLGTIKQGEGQSSINIDDLKAQVTTSGTTETTSGVKVEYKPRHEVFNDCTEENKNDIVIVATGIKEGSYEINPYIGKNSENTTATVNQPITVEIKDTTTIKNIKIDGTVQVICDGSWQGETNSKNQKVYTTTKNVEGKDEIVHYTLLPISFLDQYGKKQELLPEDFAGYENGIAHKITVSDNYGYNIPGLDVKLFRKAKVFGEDSTEIVEAGGDNTFDYIGFAITHNANINEMKKKDGKVTITYGPSNLVSSAKVTLNVQLVD